MMISQKTCSDLFFRLVISAHSLILVGLSCTIFAKIIESLSRELIMNENNPLQDQLLTDAKSGSPDAVDRLISHHREPLRRMINNRIDPALSARVDASDIVQDVMLEAHRRLSDYLRNPEAMPFHLWLRHIALDHIIDAHRKHRVAKRRSLDREKPLVISGMNDQSSIELAGQLLANEVTPASAAIHAELKSRLDSAINLLDPDDREIVLMRHAEQMTNQEVSALLGLTEAAASMRYLRAVRKLRSGLLPGGL